MRSNDAALLTSLRGLRGLSYGFLNTALGLYLNDIGYNLLYVGLFVTAAGFFSALLILLSGVLSDRLGNRKLFLIFSCALMVVLGAVYWATVNFTLLLVATMLGGAGSAGGGAPGGGAFGPAQQALLAEKVRDENRNKVFTINAFAGTALFSLGAVAAGLPETLAHSVVGVQQLYRESFLGFAIVGLFMVVMSASVHEERWQRESVKKSRGIIGKFLVTTTLNGFGFGFIPLPLLTLWFRVTYNASEALISLVIGASNLASAFSLLLAPVLAKWWGAVKMTVATRIVGIALLISMPVMPLFAAASAAYIIRGAFVTVGMPIRQSYMMGVVDRKNRATAIGVSSGIGWGIPYAITPTISGYIMEEVNSSLPIYASGLLQLANSAAYYTLFHKLHPPEEVSDEQ